MKLGTWTLSHRVACFALLLAGCHRGPGGADTPAGTENQAASSGARPAPAADPRGAGARDFRFSYVVSVTDLAPGAKARVWVPIAPTNSDQVAQITSMDLPGKYRRETEPKHGNQLLYFEAAANDEGHIPLEIEYMVTRRGLSRRGTPAGAQPRAQFLAGSSLVPVNGTIVKHFFSDQLPSGTTREIARYLYDRVELHMRYDRTGEGWGRGDALWACDSKRGNCSDFHSVFIALCRDLSIPAKFEIGFPLPAEEGRGEIDGYHCWAKFLDGDRWIGVDISEADKHPEKRDFFFGNLPPDRVMFSTERDLELVPPQDAGPVNFLVCPYVEVAGKPHTKLDKHFRFEDL